nr:hypothetical protein [Tanacetum cinerariifolium]
MGAEADFNNMDSSTVVSLIPTHKVHKDHPKDQIIGDPKSAVQTRGMAKKNTIAHAFMEPKKVAQALNDESRIEAINKKDERGIVVRNKARLVVQGHRQEEGIDYNEVLAFMAWIKAIRIFLAFSSFMGFIVYQIDFPNKVYKVEKALYGIHQAPRAWFQVTPKLSHLHAMKRIFRYLKGQPKLGLWYPRDSPFDLKAYLNIDYAGANLERISTTGGCQFVGKRLVSWQCKKQTIVATSTTEAEYVTPANCCGQSIDPHLSTGYTVGSGEDRMEHDIELTDLIPQTPHDLPLSQEAKEISSLKRRVTKLKQRQSSRFLGFYPFRAGASKRHNLGRRRVSKQGRKNLKSQQMFQDNVLDKDADTEMIVEDKGNGEKGGSTAETVSNARPDISAARLELSTAKLKTPHTTTTLFDDEDVTIAETLVKIKNQKAKEKRISFKDTDDSARPIISITTLQPLPTIDPKDKEARIERERQEEASKAALVEMYDEVQAQIDVDHELAVRLTHEEQEQYTVEERSFKEIQKLYIKEHKWVDAFVPIGYKEDEKRIGSRKKRAAGLSSKHKSPKKQKAKTLEYLGHIILGDWVRIDPNKIKVVREWPEPTTQLQVRGFLGHAGYYRRFIKGYATTMAPLTDLLRKDGFKWGVQKAPAIEELKQWLSTTPVLGLSEFNEVFVVEADASAMIYARVRREQGLIIFQDIYYVGNESKLKKLLLQEFHDTPYARHGRVKKMLVGLLALFYWPRMRRLVEEYVKQCLVFQQTKYSMQAMGGYLQPLPTPYVWEDVSIDFITGLPVSKGLSVILVVVDRFSNGTQLNRITTYQPQTDEQTKLVNRGLEQYLRAMVSDRPSQWVCLLPWAEFCYNTGYHSSIKMSHFEALYGRLPLSLRPYPLNSSKVTVLEELLVERNGLMRRLKQNLVEARNRMKVKAIVIGVTWSSIRGIRVGTMGICDSRLVLRNGSLVQQVLVQWDGQSSEEATWKWMSNFKDTYPSSNLEDKVISHERENVMPAIDGLGCRKRTKKASGKQKEFVMG